MYAYLVCDFTQAIKSLSPIALLLSKAMYTVQTIFYPCTIFVIFLVLVLYSTLLHLPPLSFPVSEDAGNEPRTVLATALAADALTTRLDLIH